MESVDWADQMMHFHPCCRYPMKRTKGFMLFLLQMATPNRFIFCQKYTTNETKRVRGWGLWLHELHTGLCSENDRASTEWKTEW